MNQINFEALPQKTFKNCHKCEKSVLVYFNPHDLEKRRIQKLFIESESSGYTFLPGGRFIDWGNDQSEFYCWGCAKNILAAGGLDTTGFEYTWQDYDEGMEQLTNKVDKPYNIICGVARAGAIPAAHLAMNLTATLWILDMNIQISIDFLDILSDSNNSILIVDDFINTGNTIAKVNNIFPDKKFDWATLVLNTSCEEAKKVTTIYYHKTIGKGVNNIFVKFPWGPG